MITASIFILFYLLVLKWWLMGDFTTKKNSPQLHTNKRLIINPLRLVMLPTAW